MLCAITIAGLSGKEILTGVAVIAGIALLVKGMNTQPRGQGGNNGNNSNGSNSAASSVSNSNNSGNGQN